LTPPILDENGVRLGIEVVDLASGERRVLARRSGPDVGQPRLEGDFAGPRVGPYRFSRRALQWGQDVVARAIAVGCDLLVVDEIGRLELERNEGFDHVLDLLETSIVLRSLVVVRATLLGTFRQRLPELEFITFEVTDNNRHTLPLEITERLFLA
jgi:nucleoside-triphosphatase THEP1